MRCTPTRWASSPVILKVSPFDVTKEGVENSKVLLTAINTTVNPKIRAATMTRIYVA